MAEEGINVAGLAGLIVFYLAILGVGIGVGVWKTWLNKRRKTDEMETMIVADRSIGLFVGIITMTATWVGGGFINGTAEAVYRYGLLYAQTPVGYGISLLISGFMFAGPYRSREYLTMIDPFQEKYGVYVGSLMYFPALLGEIFWCAAILNALGASVSVILGLDFTTSVIVSAGFSVAYTFLGGMFSVAYTDVLQLCCIPVGLVLAIPFAWNNENVNMNLISETKDGMPKWLGTVPSESIGGYIDLFVLLICGGIPWQAVTFVGLGAISAAVMSSTDSSLLSASSMFAYNVYKAVFRPRASFKEVVWVLRFTVLFCGIVASALGIQVKSVYELFYLCGDFVFVMLFPQMVLVIYAAFVNSYGVLSGFSLALILRLFVGVPEAGFPGAFTYGANVPYKTIVMLLNHGITIIVSVATNAYFLKQRCPRTWDILNAYEWERGLCLGVRRIRDPVTFRRSRIADKDHLPMEAFQKF